jgi:hypothetical protein
MQDGVVAAAWAKHGQEPTPPQLLLRYMRDPHAVLVASSQRLQQTQVCESLEVFDHAAAHGPDCRLPSALPSHAPCVIATAVLCGLCCFGAAALLRSI